MAADAAGLLDPPGLTGVFDRGYDTLAMQRQRPAVVATGDRIERLRALRVPAPVPHGACDVLCDAGGGRATAAAVPGTAG
ncbi:hypothetical protein [Streptomyces sp. NPDC001194]|uniref:hypothetical protein n=1 Tax=Streptomyces sp. NPDC001194 TaxID=3364547 RepID=UPI0036B8D5A2